MPQSIYIYAIVYMRVYAFFLTKAPPRIIIHILAIFFILYGPATYYGLLLIPNSAGP